MKKKYIKPMIVFEHFALCTNIAGDCEAISDGPTENTCGMDFSGLTVFLDTMGGCASYPVASSGGDGKFNNICYHVPDGFNLFTS